MSMNEKNCVVKRLFIKVKTKQNSLFDNYCSFLQTIFNS